MQEKVNGRKDLLFQPRGRVHDLELFQKRMSTGTVEDKTEVMYRLYKGESARMMGKMMPNVYKAKYSTEVFHHVMRTGQEVDDVLLRIIIRAQEASAEAHFQRRYTASTHDCPRSTRELRVGSRRP